jgi:hypothetical protein
MASNAESWTALNHYQARAVHRNGVAIESVVKSAGFKDIRA